jgi:flagellar hook-associated protein 1 FlgK
MSDLLSSLSLAAHSMAAEQAGLAVTGQNIANVNTPGYTRRTIDLAAAPPTDPLSAGNGVDVAGIRAERASLLESQLLHEQPAQGRAGVMADALSQIESALGTPGSSVDASLTKFYNAFSQLAQDPTSGVARQQVTVQAQSLTASFHDVATRLATAQSDADAQVKSSVEQINQLATQIASLNASISAGSATSGEAIKDQLGVALSALSGLIDINVVPRADGGADVSVGNGHALVIGANAYQVGVTQRAGTGFADLTSAGSVITAEVTGGAIGGLLQVRDVLLPGYTTRLDQLAYGVETDVNTAHEAGFDLNGAAGGDFFVAPAAVAGAASSMAVSANILNNPNLIAAASTATPGDNQNAMAIANLQQAPLAGGPTNPIDTWGALVYRVGTDAQSATNDKAGRDEVVTQLQTLRDQISGVSLDEEAANMMKFQRAYEANARYFSAIETSLSVLMSALGTGTA